MWNTAKRQKGATDLMLGLSQSIDQFVIVYNVHWYGHVLKREDGHVLRWALDFEVNGQRKKWWAKRTCRKHVKEESVKVGLC